MIEDYCQSNTETGAINLLLREIRSVFGEKLMATYKLPPITEDIGTSGVNEFVSEEVRIPVPPEYLSSIDMLNADQKYAFDRVVNFVMLGEKSIFFIDGPGGSGIAATMMSGGKTAHSSSATSGIAATSTCNIGAEDPLADFIRKADLIIWDEATMANRYAFEALDTTLRDLTKVELPFGGKILLLGGDFRPVFLVVEHGTRAQTTSACLTNAKFWKDVKVIRLK
ncbi:ATP-dependent DNA helicase PIF2-like [Papaver somniferum]|uniref:ATP-dependent DNA helicase PIF2-like n=1 Tax=Papaver somniferum TaxID=3469 RepID=UPI000E6FBD51|nr:ATP-dependent DNA helicase PIF2-like [Papaver somniferum]